MPETLKLLAYWPSRKETASGCSERLSRLLIGLASCAPIFETWYRRGSTLKDAQKRPIDPANERALLALVESGINRKDIGGERIPHLGFRIGLWTGSGSDTSIGLSIGCGMYDEGGRYSFLNSVIMSFVDPAGDLSDVSTMTAILTSVVSAWRPARAVVTSMATMKARGFDAKIPFVDRLTYVPATGLMVEPPFSVTTIAGVGSIVVSGSDPLTGRDDLTPENIRTVESFFPAVD